MKFTHTHNLFQSLISNPDEWSNNDANDNNNINCYLYGLPTLFSGTMLNFFTCIIWFNSKRKSKKERTFNIPTSKFIKLDGRPGTHIQECIDPK